MSGQVCSKYSEALHLLLVLLRAVYESVVFIGNGIRLLVLLPVLMLPLLLTLLHAVAWVGDDMQLLLLLLIPSSRLLLILVLGLLLLLLLGLLSAQTSPKTPFLMLAFFFALAFA